MSKLNQQIASGQYEFPKGLYFGGKQASETFEVVRRELEYGVCRGSNPRLCWTSIPALATADNSRC